MSGMRLLQLINDILDAAKMKQGGVIIKHQQVWCGLMCARSWLSKLLILRTP